LISLVVFVQASHGDRQTDKQVNIVIV